MKLVMKNMSLIGLFVGLLTVVLTTTVSAHVIVKPAEVLTAGFQTFSIGVPNEKAISTTSVKLLVPEGLKHVMPTQKDGWNITTEKTGEGDEASVTSITWTGNTVQPGFRDEFTFSGQVPDTATELHWKAYQTYSDGTVVSWDKKDDGGHDELGNSGPFSITKVVTQTANESDLNATQQVASVAKDSSSTALYVGIAGVVVGLVGIFLATRKK